nr:hypothetical protein BaRGS_017008 [Batillaria attramentaria]
MQYLDNFFFPMFPFNTDSRAHLHDIYNLPIRDDDVLLWAYAKTGYCEKRVLFVTYAKTGYCEKRVLFVTYAKTGYCEKRVLFVTYAKTGYCEKRVLFVTYAKTGYREKRVLFVTYAKTGEAQYDKNTKENYTIDFMTTKMLEDMPSPRTLNCHFLFQHLPKGFFEKNNKIIVVHRDPKDVCVSWYHHMVGTDNISPYNGEFPDYLEMFVEGTGK